MGSAFHQLCPRYSGTLTPTAPTANRLWDTFTFFVVSYVHEVLVNCLGGLSLPRKSVVRLSDHPRHDLRSLPLKQSINNNNKD